MIPRIIFEFIKEKIMKRFKGLLRKIFSRKQKIKMIGSYENEHESFQIWM